MKLRVLSPVLCDGASYAEGDTLEVKDEAQAAALIACGAAEAVAEKAKAAKKDAEA